MVSFAKGMNYDPSFIMLSGNFALITDSWFVRSQKKKESRMNPFFLAPEQ